MASALVWNGITSVILAFKHPFTTLHLSFGRQVESRERRANIFELRSPKIDCRLLKKTFPAATFPTLVCVCVRRYSSTRGRDSKTAPFFVPGCFSTFFVPRRIFPRSGDATRRPGGVIHSALRRHLPACKLVGTPVFHECPAALFAIFFFFFFLRAAGHRRQEAFQKEKERASNDGRDEDGSFWLLLYCLCATVHTRSESRRDAVFRVGVCSSRMYTFAFWFATSPR